MKPARDKAPVTLDLVRQALRVIPADCDRELWARLAMSIKSEFPGPDGLDLFLEWSATGGDAFDAKAARSTWRSVRAAGGVGIGTLLHVAREHGFEPPKAPARGSDRHGSAPTSEDATTRRRAREAHEATEQAKAQALAAEAARAFWDAASPAQGGEGYLMRKGCKPYAVRVNAAGELVVPMLDATTGELCNVQRILGAKPASGPDKFYGPQGVKGSRKAGLMHWCGDPTGAPVIAACEGYATAASVHECTGLPVAVCFDAGNMATIAKALRRRFDKARILIAADDDRSTADRTGKNPGIEAAERAARAVGGVLVLPAPLPPGGSDFNDVHAASGPDAVRKCFDDAMQSTAQDVKGGADSGEGVDPFVIDAKGVWHWAIDPEGKRKAPEWVCSPLEVVALTRDADGNGWGYLLAFADPSWRPRAWAMPARMLAGAGDEYRAALLAMGLRIAPSPRARHLLTQYLQTRNPDEVALCTDRIGWHGRAFVLPAETLAPAGHERIVFQSEAQTEATFAARGTLAQWCESVAGLCVGNSRLAFAVSCAFAGPLMRPAGIESGGFHFRGASSSGKTTALRAGASVYGGERFMQRWRATDNALEAVAAQHSETILVLDELAQVDPKTAGECAYLLANEQGKARATRTGQTRPRLTWRILFLSAGELALSEHMAEGMKRTRTGQEVRMADVPADAGAGMGLLQELHGREGAGELARELVQQAGKFYGTAGLAWLEWLVAHVDELRPKVRELMAQLEAQFVPEAASGQVWRVGSRFALVGAAGELATRAGITGWPEGTASAAARECFNAWLAARGGIGDGEIVAMLRQVRRFLEAHAEGRFSMWHRTADDRAPKTLSRAGVRRMVDADGQPIKTNADHQREFGERMPAMLGEGVSFEYFILPEVFRAEVCQGFDHEAVLRALLHFECLMPDKGRTFDSKRKLPGIGDARCYRIAPRIFALDV